MTLYVNDEKIEDGTLEKEIERLRPHYEEVFAGQDGEEKEQRLVQWSRENLIERVVMKQEAMKLDADFSDEVDKEYQTVMEQSGGEEKFFADRGLDISEKTHLQRDLELQVRIKHLVEKISKKAGEPNSKDIEEFYSENIEHFTIPEMLRASHIVKHIKPDEENEELFNEISQARKEIDEGADFDELTAKYSNCADNGGDLGFFARGKMVQDFEDVAFDMEVGEISDVFRTEFGYHIAKVTDRKTARVCEIDEVREYIIKQLGEQAKEKAVEKFLDEKMVKAVIKEV